MACSETPRSEPDQSAASSAEADVPLSVTWREWIEKVPVSKSPGRSPVALKDVDVVVVGSGYGGAVAALRLAEKGYRVCVLERGSEYLPGEFPNHFSQVPKHFRTNVPGRPLPLGRASGLVEISVGQGMIAVTGNGLGGGSLINAGVVIKPDDDVFAQNEWPAGIRHATPAAPGVIPLNRAFVKARTALGAQSYQPPLGPSATACAPQKAQTLIKLAKEAGMGGRLNQQALDLTMNPDVCTQCGDCASGCNVAGAKGDLRSTYLKKALDTGRVQIVTQAEVYRFEPHWAQAPSAEKQPVFGGWAVDVFATDAQHHKSSRQEAGDLHDQSIDPASSMRRIVAPRLIISAGTLGSTQLLQRSQALTDERLAFSPSLGTRLSGNGDALSVLVHAEDRVNAVGHGSLPPGAAFSKVNPAHYPHIVGPTITAAIDGRDKTRPLDERVLLQEGAIPGSIARGFEELLVSALTVQQLDRWSFKAPPVKAHQTKERLDPLAASRELAAQAQVWLTMGHDGSPGRILWLPGTDASAMVMPSPQDLPTYHAQQRLFDQLRGQHIHIHSPLWQMLPTGMQALMSGAKPPPFITTVHPLGGCPMSDDPKQGVVNEYGAVWIHQPSHPARKWAIPNGPAKDARYPESPATYPNLFVLDGSIVPTSLGCNPLLTITALAERAVSAWPTRAPTALAAPPYQSAPRPLETPRLTPHQWEVTLREELTAGKGDFGGAWRAFEKLALNVEFCVDDFEDSLKRADHPLQIKHATLNVTTQTGVIRYEACKFPNFHFLSAPAWHGQGRWPLVWTVIELLLLLLPCLFALASLAALASVCFGHPLTSGGPLKPMGTAVTSLAAFLVLLVWLPTSRTFLTWFVSRGHRDLRQAFKSGRTDLRTDMERRWRWSPGKLRALLNALTSAPGKLRGLIKQFVHSRERRLMLYDMVLQKSGPAHEHFPERIRLRANKVVVYRASVGELLTWLLRQLRPRPVDGRAPLRPSYWERIMDAEARIAPDGSPWPSFAYLFKGRLRMGQENLFRASTAQLGPKGDTTTGLLMMSGYALLAIRFAIKTHLFDFRLPNYSKRPVSDKSSGVDVVLSNPKNGSTTTKPRRHWITVDRGYSSGDAGNESMEPLRLSLLQYRQRDLEWNSPVADQPDDVRRAKVVLLLHAFGQSGLTFTYSNQKTSSLARHLFDKGYEVWVLDSRMSTRGGYAEQACNVDMMGEHDVPQAVNYILRSVQCRRNKTPGMPAAQVQIALMAQCIGSASAWMSVLSGKLDQGGVSKIYALVSSQVHPVMYGSAMTEAKTWLPSLVRHAANIVPFAVRGPQEGAGGAVMQLLDRLFSSMPVPEAERALSDNEDAVATCRRIRFIEAPLFHHRNMSTETIRDMPRLFGNANVRLFEHARRFVSTHHHRLVDEDGLNRYATESNARRHVTFPVMLLHGERNELFDVQSARESRRWLDGAGAWLPLSQCFVVKDYGHLDVLLGENASQDVFDKISSFLDTAHVGGKAKQTFNTPRWKLVNPKHGPVLGWVRNKGTVTLVRSSLILDDGIPPIGTDPGFLLITNGSVKVPMVGATHYALVVRTRSGSLPPPKASLNVKPFVVARPALSAAVSTPAFLAIRIDITVSTPAQPFECEVLVFQPTESSSGLSISELQSDQQLNGHRDAMGGAALFPPIRVHPPALDTGPSSKDVTLWAACCRYPALSVDVERIDTQLQNALDKALKEPKSLPAMALLLGDQIYADATAGLVDPVSPIERYFERHVAAFNTKAMRELQRNIPTLMTPDDHEWTDNFPNAAPLLKWPWPNWGAGSAFMKRQDAIYSWATKSVFAFQKIQGPTNGFWPQGKVVLPRLETADAGPVRVFMLDSRSYRKRSMPRVLNRGTLKRLIAWLNQLGDDTLPVIVSGSVILPGLYENADPANPGPPDTWQHAPRQRELLLGCLVQRKKPFLLLSGDYHVSAALTICKDDGEHLGAAIVAPPLYAPLPYANARPHHLNLKETFTLAGSSLRLVVPPNGHALSGSGLACIQVERHSSGGFAVTITRDLLTLGEASPNTGSTTYVTTICLP